MTDVEEVEVAAGGTEADAVVLEVVVAAGEEAEADV